MKSVISVPLVSPNGIAIKMTVKPLYNTWTKSYPLAFAVILLAAWLELKMHDLKSAKQLCLEATGFTIRVVKCHVTNHLRTEKELFCLAGGTTRTCTQT